MSGKIIVFGRGEGNNFWFELSVGWKNGEFEKSTIFSKNRLVCSPIVKYCYVGKIVWDMTLTLKY